MIYTIDPNTALELHHLNSLLLPGSKIQLSDEAKKRISACRAYLDEAIGPDSPPVYGINTGFGALYDKSVSAEDLEQLQRNLLISHACGMGDLFPSQVVKLMLVLKVKGLSYGHSGVQLETVERLCTFFNEDVLPVVYQLGSLGASGDLAPLAHLTIPMLGVGEVVLKGVRMPSDKALVALGLEPIRLKSKEGLALINGTQFMSAYACYCLIKAEQIVDKGTLVAAMSLEGFDGRPEPFDDLTHQVRPHSGQVAVADRMHQLLQGSTMQLQPKKHVQDPYSFRCIPQVHGASWDAIAYAKHVVRTEINAVTDNPIIFPAQKRIISGGNFHGQPLALVLDFLSIAIAELGSMSERRTYKLISGQRGLPAFLTPDPGLHSGFMIAQYTAAGIVSQNKQLCTPASVDTIDSSNGQEDHVSMGANAATKCFRVVLNVERLIGIEALNAAQALEFRRPNKASVEVENLYIEIRRTVPKVTDDVYLHQLMVDATDALFA
jgi:histidine ammonia-lyase